MAATAWVPASRSRTLLLRAIGLLGVVLLAGGLALGHFRRGLFDDRAFADGVARSLDDPRVAAFVASRITDEVLRYSPDLTAFRPLVLGATQGIVSSRAFQSVARTTARTAHAAAFSEGGRDVLLTVDDAGVLLRSALASANPDLAAKIPDRVQAVVAGLGRGRASRIVLETSQRASRIARLSRSATATGVVLLLISVLLAADRRRALLNAGANVASAGLLLALLLPVGRFLASSLTADPLARAAVAGLFDAFAGGLRTWALVLVGVGIVFGAAARSLLDDVSAADLLRPVWRALKDPPGGLWGRAGRAAALACSGAVAILHPRWTQDAIALLVGSALAFLGLLDVFRILERAVHAPARPGDATSRTSRVMLWRVAAVLALAVVLAGAALWMGRPREPAPLPITDTCNGDAALCERRLDEVVFAGAHNAMSSADVPNWMFPQQERGVAGMLADGVRALLVDVHNGRPVVGTGHVKTDLDSEKAFITKVQQAVGPEGVAAAMRIRDRFTGEEEGPRALYLCHGFCELGALPLTPWLRTVRDFLTLNPHEVVIFVLEDYVEPADIAAAFAEAGLDRLVYRGDPKGPWPTLRELADSRQQVVAFLESGKPGVPWLSPAFATLQETPYSFHQVEDFSCAANRGGTDGSLFQINHWIDTTPAPKPSNAAIVNAYDFLLARARKCQDERKKLQNILAVDFYRTGDLFSVVRTLNGVHDPRQ